MIEIKKPPGLLVPEVFGLKGPATDYFFITF